MSKRVGVTSGVILDPFSLFLTGLMRKNRGIKSDYGSKELFDLAHGEARFKQAFVNACHFAESMTVVGPVAQLAWDLNKPDYVEPALRWRAGMEKAGNEYFAQSVQDFLRKAAWNNIPVERWLNADTQELLLHTLPDFSLARELSDDKQFKRWDTHSGALFKFLFREGGSGDYFTRDKVKEALTASCGSAYAETYGEVNSGLPVMGLMAVTFTFKKPTGVLNIGELTNLASWPPVTFFLPVLMPSGSSLEQNGYGLGSRATRQPAMSTYRISLQTGKRILPYGQPYLLTSVKEAGKAPDTLRSLSDVFKALWSQATLYSAWNMSFNADMEQSPISYPATDHSQWTDFIGEFCLEPMGAGRRIRGHNRHMSKYDLSDVSFMWEENIGCGAGILHGWNLTGTDKRPFDRQLRSDRNRGKKEAIFVLPSYMSESMKDSMMPVAMGMARFMFGGNLTGLEGFLSSQVMNDLSINHCGADPIKAREKSFVERIAQARGEDPDTKNVGALPVTRIKGDIAFDPEGDPTVFGLSMNRSVQEHLYADALAECPEETYTKIASETGVLGNFHFLDAFCSTSTKDLTQVFGEIKKKSFKEGSKASKLLDEALSIDLFDEDIGML